MPNIDFDAELEKIINEGINEEIIGYKFSQQQDCPDCGGRGTYTGLLVVETCDTCHGSGVV